VVGRGVNLCRQKKIWDSQKKKKKNGDHPRSLQIFIATDVFSMSTAGALLFFYPK
jgi:hypothetical protein